MCDIGNKIMHFRFYGVCKYHVTIHFYPFFPLKLGSIEINDLAGKYPEGGGLGAP